MLAASHKNIIDKEKNDFTRAGAIFLSNYPSCFVGKEEHWHAIRLRIATNFSIEVSNVRLTGSGHLGASAFKSTIFDEKKSDLDIAIISPALFSRYLTWVILETKSFTRLSAFPRLSDGRSGLEEFKLYVSQKGMIRPDLLPAGKFKTEWMSFFRDLSADNSLLCKKITAAIYVSEECFVQKQIPSIRKFI
ncbi:hypothetical protein [Rhizobium sp. RU20A]|uniref:hypothetical protein n=1 Tax=Rhizobium sp. RU20A TaxID=1907412 RepID=UPI00122D4362|nr:hypothetical protein [Rhizobium sp. RU20A]